MHELLKHVLTERDLTRAGDLFSIPDSEIVDDLNEVLKQITEISSRPDYIRNDHDQALIEICVTRVTSCVKETGTLEKYCGNLVALLESCLHHNLMPVGHLRDDDPPHAKIASDVIACIVLVSFPIQSDKEISGNKAVMELFLPVAVQFLHKGNREISRHMARYLSLAAVHHAMLLKPHVQTIMDSIMTGNYPLSRILTNLYEVCPEPLEGHVMALVSLLPHAEQVEKNSLFALFEQIAARRPDALKTCVPQLLSYLCPHTTPPSDPGCMCVDLLQLIVCLSRARASLVLEQGAALRRAARPPHASPRAVALVAAALAQIGRTDRDRAQEALNFILESMSASGAAQAALLRECTTLCSAYPALFTERVLSAVRANHSGEVNRTASGVTIVKLGGSSAPPATTTVTQTTSAYSGGYTRRAKLGDSRSTGRLHPGPAPRSMTRLNVPGGSVGGLHKSMTRLSSSQQINSQPTSTVTAVNNSKPTKVTVTARAPRPAPHTQSILIGPANNRDAAQHQRAPHQRVRAVPHARHRAALLREAPRQDQGLRGHAGAPPAAARQVHHRRAALQEAGAAAVRVRHARAALPVRAHAVLHAHARAARVDPPHVPGAAGAPRRRAVLARRLRRQPQALLGHPQVREQDLPHARHQRLPRDQGARDAAERAARGGVLRRVLADGGRRARAGVGLLPVRAPGARARLPAARRARHRGHAAREEGPLAPLPPLAHALLHALRRAPQRQGLERRREHRHQPDPLGEGVARRPQHPEGVRDLHGRPDTDPQAGGRRRGAVGAVPQHRRRQLAGAPRARQGQQPAGQGAHAQELLR